MWLGQVRVSPRLRLSDSGHCGTNFLAPVRRAVSLGTTAILISPHSVSMVAMTVLPLSLVPTFLVPLFLIFHVICIAQARAWKVALGDARQIARPVQALATEGFQSQRAG
jgi:hypothetical protein